MSSIAFETVKSQKGRETEKHDFETTSFIFKFFKLRKFGDRSWHQIKQTFFINYEYFWTYSIFLLKFSHIIKQIWSNVTIPLHQECCLTFIYCCIKFYCPNLGESWVIEACKSPILCDKKLHYLEYVFSS